jgi:DNA-nicking Smr family endonuclease
MSEEPPHRRPRRRLTDAERTLWSEVTRSVAPLRGRSQSGDDPDTPVVQASSPTPTAGSKPGSPAAPASAPARMLPLSPLGRRVRQRIARGSHVLGGRLDLHGMTQQQAHDALLAFLRSAQHRGDTLVLVITGKGAPGDEAGGRGVLRRQVPQWLRLSGVRDLVVGFEPAHVAHGGDGALYVRIRRPKN